MKSKIKWKIKVWDSPSKKEFGTEKAHGKEFIKLFLERVFIKLVTNIVIYIS